MVVLLAMIMEKINMCRPNVNLYAFEEAEKHSPSYPYNYSNNLSFPYISLYEQVLHH